jgi:hypothetical protein
VTSNPLAQSDHPFYVNSDELVVTRGLDPVAASPCQRTLLPREQTWPTHHIGGHLGRMLDGTLCALVAGGEAVSRWMSPDGGRTWQPGATDLLGVGAFAVLGDDTFLAAAGGGEEAIRILRSIDRGETWEQVSRLPLGGFDAMHVDGNMLQLRDGTVLLAANMRINPPEGEGFAQGHYPQYLFRSSNGGETWEGGGDPDFWQAVRDGMETIEDDGPEYSWPGVGGTFPGVYETGFFEPTDGPLLGAFRFSGPPRPWHREVIERWGEPPADPDDHGRIFRHIVLGESADGGCSWRNLRPILDAEGQPLMAHGECNGELVQLSDNRLVLVHQTRYAEGPDRVAGYFRGRSQLCARVSLDNGHTWLPERYRLIFGFGYSGSLVMEDDTIITVTGASLGETGDPRRAAAIRWRLSEAL